MNTYAYKATLTLIFVWLLYQIVHNYAFLLFFILAVVFLVLYKSSPKETQRHTNYLWTSLVLFLASFVFTSAFWVLLALFLLFQLSTDEKLLHTMRDPLSRKKQYWRDKEFISVQINEIEANELRLYRNKWLGDDAVGKDIFEWEDYNHQKVMGDTFFDLGNTVLPLKENVLMLRKGFGDTKIIVPKDVAISLDISMILGKLIIEDEVFDMKNETVKWQSKNYEKALRKIKVVSSTLIGEIEVVFL